MNEIRDTWTGDARKRLTAWVLGAPGRGRDYAPDTTYELLKAGRSGPHTLAIAEVMRRWSAMWAADMREAAAAELDIDGNATWLRCMAEADAEIDRYMANNHLTRAA